MAEPLIAVDFQDVAGGVIDLTPHMRRIEEGGISGLSRRLSYLSRETDFGRVSLLVQNGEGHFSEDHENFLLGSGNYLNRRVRIRWGWISDTGERTEPDNLFVGFLEDIQIDTEGKGAELKLTDVQDRLKLSGPSGTKRLELFDGDTPAFVALTILGADYADIPFEFVDLESFTDADTTESLAGILLSNFRIQDGSWWDSLKILLAHAGAGIRVNRHGQLVYFSYAPDTADGDPSLTFPTIRRVRGGKTLQTVRNATVAYKGDGTDPGDGSPPPTDPPGTELTVDTSIAAYGTRWRERDRELTFLDDQAAVDLVVDRDLEIEAKAPGKYKAYVPFDETTYLIDLAQRVKFTVEDLGWSEKTVTVDEVSPDFSRMGLNLGIIDTDLDGDIYLYVNRSGHKVDDGKLIY